MRRSGVPKLSKIASVRHALVICRISYRTIIGRNLIANRLAIRTSSLVEGFRYVETMRHALRVEPTKLIPDLKASIFDGDHHTVVSPCAGERKHMTARFQDS